MKMSLKKMSLIMGVQFINLMCHSLLTDYYPKIGWLFHIINWIVTLVIVINICRYIFQDENYKKFDVVKISVVIWALDTILVILVLLAEIPLEGSTFQEMQMVIAGYLLSSILNFFIFFILVFVSSKIWRKGSGGGGTH